jgi:hypothetical protein
MIYIIPLSLFAAAFLSWYLETRQERKAAEEHNRQIQSGHIVCNQHWSK